MKTTLGMALLALLILAAVAVYRAGTAFPPPPGAGATELAPLALDEDAAVARFARSLTFPTVSYDDRTRFDAAAFEAFHGYLEEAFPGVHAVARRERINGYSLLYEIPGSDAELKPALFMGHFDVVPVEEHTLGEWTHPPFSGAVADGIVWGRGSVDDKLGVMGLMEALERLLAGGFLPRRTLFFAFGHDEEVGGRDGAARIAEHLSARGVRLDFVMDEGGALTRGILEGVQRPVAIIGTSEKGYVNLVLTVEAPGGHSSQPPPQSALGILSRAIVKVEDSPFPATLDYLLPTITAIGAEMPFRSRLALANLWLFGPLVKRSLLADPDNAAGLRTTTAATMASGSPKSNILPTRATGVINFRILPGETAEQVRDRVVGIIDDERVQVEMEYAIDPSPLSPTDSDGYRLVERTIRAMEPAALVAPYLVRGGTDARYFHGLTPNVYRFMMIDVNPDTIRFIHGIDERVPAADYVRAVRFYAHLLEQAGNGS